MKQVLAIAAGLVLLAGALILQAVTDSSVAAVVVFAVGLVLLIARYELSNRRG